MGRWFRAALLALPTAAAVPVLLNALLVVALTASLCGLGACKRGAADRGGDVASPAEPAASATPAEPVLVPPSEPPVAQILPGTSQFRVRTATLCRSVKLREPVGPTWRFGADDDQVWLHLSVRSLGAKRRLKVRWLHGDEAVQEVDLHVGQNPRFRTWSFLDLTKDRRPGGWTVEVLGMEGEPLARAEFWVDPRPEGRPGERLDGQPDHQVEGRAKGRAAGGVE